MASFMHPTSDHLSTTDAAGRAVQVDFPYETEDEDLIATLLANGAEQVVAPQHKVTKPKPPEGGDV